MSENNNGLRVLYVSRFGAGEKDERGEGELFESGYIKRYKDNLIKIQQKNEWKHRGSGAAFTGSSREDAELETFIASVNGISAYDEKGFIYSARAGDVSGILYKDYESGGENHLIHSNREQFYSLEYDAAKKQILTALSSDFETRHIALYDVVSNDFKILTDGDSVDDSPAFSRADGRILYSSRGIGRNVNMEMAELSESTLFAVTERGDVEEIMSEEGFDLLSPKTDAEGNLYYIRKPRSKRKKKGTGSILLDIILLPFWLVYGIFRLALFLGQFAKKSAGKSTSKSTGDNPSLSKDKSEREMFIYQELINIEEEEKKNTKKGDKEAGFAPSSFVLMRMSKDGNVAKLREGVLDYDVDEGGNVIYTNGRYVFTLKKGAGDEGKDAPARRTLFKDRLITKVKHKNVYSGRAEVTIFD